MPRIISTTYPSFEGFSSPNYTQVPDELFDLLMPQLSDIELRVLLYIIRRTFGFKKSADDISLKQIVEGLSGRDGQQLDYGAGVSKPSAVKAVKGLVEKGIITAQRNRSHEKGDEPTTYTLRFQQTPVLTGFTRGGSQSRLHPRVNGVDTQETDGQETDGTIRKAPLEFSVQETETITPATLPWAVEHSTVEPPVTPETDRQDVARDASRRARSRAVPNRENPAPTVERAPEPDGEGFRTFRAQALRLRAELAARRELDQQASGEGSAAHPPPGSRRGRPPGTREERELVMAYLADFAIELNDQAPLAATVTRALRAFQAADVPPERWGDYLYRARAITQAHTATIATRVAGQEQTMRAKNKTPYYFAVLEHLLGLRPAPEWRPTEAPG